MDELPVSQKIVNFFAKFPTQTYQPGSLIIQSGNQPSGVYHLKTGIVKMYTISQNGDEIILNLFHPPAFFPMSWAINDTANFYYYETVSECAAQIAPRDQVIDFLKANPDVLYDLLSRVYKGTDGILLRMNFLLAGNKYANVITELLITAKRFGSAGPDENSVTVKINQQAIAAQSGMARETVSRAMKVLKDKGFISFDHHTLTIHNIKHLEAELYSL